MENTVTTHSRMNRWLLPLWRYSLSHWPATGISARIFLVTGLILCLLLVVCFSHYHSLDAIEKHFREFQQYNSQAQSVFLLAEYVKELTNRKDLPFSNEM